jgi:hypothetical protein
MAQQSLFVECLAISAGVSTITVVTGGRETLGGVEGVGGVSVGGAVVGSGAVEIGAVFPPAVEGIGRATTGALGGASKLRGSMLTQPAQSRMIPIKKIMSSVERIQRMWGTNN